MKIKGLGGSFVTLGPGSVPNIGLAQELRCVVGGCQAGKRFWCLRRGGAYREVSVARILWHG